MARTRGGSKGRGVGRSQGGRRESPISVDDETESPRHGRRHETPVSVENTQSPRRGRRRETPISVESTKSPRRSPRQTQTKTRSSTPSQEKASPSVKKKNPSRSKDSSKHGSKESSSHQSQKRKKPDQPSKPERPSKRRYPDPFAYPYCDEHGNPLPVSSLNPVLEIMPPPPVGVSEPVAEPMVEGETEPVFEGDGDRDVPEADNECDLPERDADRVVSPVANEDVGNEAVPNVVDHDLPKAVVPPVANEGDRDEDVVQNVDNPIDVDGDDGDFGLVEEDLEDFRAEFGEGVEVQNDENVVAVQVPNEDEDSDVDDDDAIPQPTVASDYEANDEVPDPNLNANDGVEDLLRLGKCFATTEDFKIVVLKYSLRNRYDIKFYRSESWRIAAKCNDKEGNCEWRVYAAYNKRRQQMQVRIYVGAHTCVRSGYSKMLKQGAIQYLFKDRLRMNPRLTKQEMAAEVLREYNLVVSEEKCSKAKTELAKQRKQSHEKHFSRVWDYQAEILQSNEGSTLEIETVPGPTIGSKQRFSKLFMCFKAQKDAWKETCRPIIGFDGAFLKWDIKGQLLAAVGRDGDNRIVPIAWAVVEIESEDDWCWFVRHLSLSLGLDDGRNLAVISDKQKVVSAF